MVFRAVEGPVRLELEMPGAVFDEGSRIEATIVVMATRDASVLGGEIELAWHRAYHYRQGTDVWGPYATATGRSSNVGDRVVLKPLGHLSPGDRISQRVALRVPAHGPGSVRTGLVDLQWEVTARLRVEKARTTEVTRPVLVLSEAADREQVTERPPTVEEHQCAGLSFTSLSSRRLVPGVALDGELTVAPPKLAKCAESGSSWFCSNTSHAVPAHQLTHCATQRMRRLMRRWSSLPWPWRTAPNWTRRGR